MSVKMVVSLGRLASKALEGGGVNGQRDASASVTRAIRCYLGDVRRGVSGWSYPAFLRQQANGGEQVELELSVDDALWHSLEEEAEHQRVSAQQMLEHAVLYFAAEVDAGRLAERILDDLDDG